MKRREDASLKGRLGAASLVAKLLCWDPEEGSGSLAKSPPGHRRHAESRRSSVPSPAEPGRRFCEPPYCIPRPGQAALVVLPRRPLLTCGTGPPQRLGGFPGSWAWVVARDCSQQAPVTAPLACTLDPPSPMPASSQAAPQALEEWLLAKAEKRVRKSKHRDLAAWRRGSPPHRAVAMTAIRALTISAAHDPSWSAAAGASRPPDPAPYHHREFNASAAGTSGQSSAVHHRLPSSGRRSLNIDDNTSGGSQLAARAAVMGAQGTRRDT
jgi:hypothetical protein